MIEIIYDGSMVKFELESIMTAWYKIDSGVRQGCPMCPLLFHIYVGELGMKVARCKQGFKYLMVNKDVVIVEKYQAMHHSHRNNRTHNIGYYDNLTNRPRTTTGLLIPHKHTGPAVKVREISYCKST